jgi:cyclic pyranopterin phosphate synthase
MVDIGDKPSTERVAVARALVELTEGTAQLVAARALPKGDALEVARVAGIMAAKRTPDLVPLCHPIALTAVEVNLEPLATGVEIIATVRTTERTGVEMEALTAVCVAALTLYDMVKGVQRDARITDVRLVAKSGGRSGDYRAE